MSHTKAVIKKEEVSYAAEFKNIKYIGPKKIDNYKTKVLERNVEKQLIGKTGKEFTCNCLKVGIFKDDIQIGEYYRNYDIMFTTFFPFEYKGKEYAIYSEIYDEISIMSLPDCKRIALDDKSGFCSVDFRIVDIDFTLYNTDDEEIINKYNITYDPHFIWVTGCFWGGRLELKLIDISEIENGKITLLQNYVNDEDLFHDTVRGTVHDCELLYNYETKEIDLELDIVIKKHISIPIKELSKVKFEGELNWG